MLLVMAFYIRPLSASRVALLAVLCLFFFVGYLLLKTYTEAISGDERKNVSCHLISDSVDPDTCCCIR